MLHSKFEDNWSLLSFFILLLFMGGFYQVAWQYPMTDAYPLIERLLDPSYLLNDFYTSTFREFSPRLASAKVIVWISNTTGTDYKDVVAYGNILRIWLYGIGLYFLFLTLSDKRTALIAFSFSALSFLSMPFLPAWWPISYDLTSSNIALVSAMFAWAFAVKGMVRTSFSLLAITVYIHPIVGAQAMIICIIIYICFFGWPALFNLFKTPTIYPFALAFSAAFFYNYFSYSQALSDERFTFINGQFRHGHHFILSHMDLEKWVSTVQMTAICVAITIWFKRKNIEDRITMPVVYYSTFMILLGLLFAELHPTRLMISFIPMRAFPILVPIIVLAVAKLAVWQWEKSNHVNFFLLFLPFLPYNHVGLTWFIFPNHHPMTLPIIVTMAVFSLLLFSHLNWLKFTLLDNLIGITFKKYSIGLHVLPIAIIAGIIGMLKFSIYIPTLENSPEIYSWLNKNTSKQDIIVTELNAADNQKIRLVARRAIVVSKDFPFNELFYEQWYERYSRLYVTRDEARGNIDSLNEQQLNSLLDEFEATILIRTKPIAGDTHFELIGETEGETAMSYIYRNKLMGAL